MSIPPLQENQFKQEKTNGVQCTSRNVAPCLTASTAEKVQEKAILLQCQKHLLIILLENKQLYRKHISYCQTLFSVECFPKTCLIWVRPTTDVCVEGQAVPSRSCPRAFPAPSTTSFFPGTCLSSHPPFSVCEQQQSWCVQHIPSRQLSILTHREQPLQTLQVALFSQLLKTPNEAALTVPLLSVPMETAELPSHSCLCLSREKKKQL